jgi:uncharacterized Zn finger protein
VATVLRSRQVEVDGEARFEIGCPARLNAHRFGA